MISAGIKEMEKSLAAGRRDWNSCIRVEVTDDLNEWIDKTVSRYQLRGFGASHLSSALTVHDALPGEFLFACYDQKLPRAARTAGLETLPDRADF